MQILISLSEGGLELYISVMLSGNSDTAELEAILQNSKDLYHETTKSIFSF